MSEKQLEGMFLHCRQCITGGKSDKVAAIYRDPMLQLWCEGCETHIATFKIAEVSQIQPTPTCQDPDHKPSPKS